LRRLFAISTARVMDDAAARVTERVMTGIT
jgi:hypothetical protein